MFVTGPPGVPGSARSGPLRLTRAQRRVFAETSDLAGDPELRVFIGDMVRPYGLPLREDLLSAPSGHAYGQMAETLLRAVVPPAEPVDLLVLAFAIHDIRIGQATAVYLSSVCPGEPLAFAVCDQGSAAAFTGLRLAGDYARTGACRRALLLVVEQSALHYRPAAVPGPAAPVPARHAAVALLFETAEAAGPGGAGGGASGGASRGGGAALTEVRQRADVAPAAVRAALAAEVAGLAAGRAGTTLVLGGALADLAGAAAGSLAGQVLVGPAGQPYTGVWWELAGRAAAGGLTLVADYDPALRYLCVSAVDGGPARAGAATPAGAAGTASAATSAGTAGTAAPAGEAGTVGVAAPAGAVGRSGR
jgi:4-hydroxymandelate oxidase